MKNKKQIIIIIISILIIVGFILVFVKPSIKSERDRLEEYLIDMDYVDFGGTYYNEFDWTYEEFMNSGADQIFHDYSFEGININNLEYEEKVNINDYDNNLRTTYSYKYNYQTDIADGYYTYSTIEGDNFHRYYSYSYNYKSGTSECVIKSHGREIGKCTLSSEFSGKMLMDTKKKFLQIINAADVNLDNYFND